MSFFSIIVPVYNKAADIQECLESVLSQTETDYEVVIVDDGSTDRSRDIIQSFSNPKIRYIFKSNGGVSSARNRGIMESKGEWVCFMDADDIMYPNALQVYREMIEKYPKVGFVVASTDQSNKQYPAQKNDYIVDDYDYCNAISYAKSGFSLINTDCICIKRSVVIEIGGFNEGYTHGEDMDLWKRLANAFPFVKSDIPVAYYKQDTANNSSSTLEYKRRYAPIAVLEHPRSYFKGYSSKLLQGERIFFCVFPSIFKSWDTKKIKILLKYLDWTSLFAIYVIYYRLIKR